MKLDILCLAAHPDDVELAMGGTIINHTQAGKSVGIVDFTKGELGSRGTAETRTQEAQAASKILGLSVRENLNLGDGFFEINEITLMSVIEQIRRFQPEIVFCNAPSDRHPDHGRGAQLAERACFLSGLLKIETSYDGSIQEKWRPKCVFNYIQDEYHEPDFVVDVTSVYEQRVQAIQAYSTQFFSPGNKGPQTPISSVEFLNFLKGRCTQFGRMIATSYGEGFLSKNPLKIEDVMTLSVK